jgi:Uma2 family endonuclease
MIVRAFPTYTADELLRLPDEKDFELIDGHLVERHMGAESGYLEALVIAKLIPWAVVNRDFVLGSSAGYQCFPDSPNRVVRPDVSFIRSERLEGGVVPEGWIKVAPDLAVEIVSPTDVFSDVVAKVADYLAVGVPLVWVVDPTLQEVHIHRRNGRPEILQTQDEFRDDAVLPGFSCRVGEFFGLMN